MQAHHLTIQKSVRYFTIGKPTGQIKHLWVCLHGYGQLADWFGKRFEKWASKERLFVFPEGPHRFYLQGTGGRVGASWMTKEDRLNDIEDQFHYLEDVVRAFLRNVPKNTKLHVLGFSQGVATALRWIDRSTLPFASVVCWAGTFPPDIDYTLQADRFKQIKMYACFGDSDEFISIENARLMVAKLEAQQIAVTPHYYSGGHRIQPDVFDVLLKALECD